MRQHKLARRSALLTAASLIALNCGTAHAQAMPSPAITATQPPLSAETQAAPSDQAASPSQTGGEQAAPGAEIVVTGIRGSQQRAINIKRNAVSVVDSISAEDIGKLPDITISDSL